MRSKLMNVAACVAGVFLALSVSPAFGQQTASGQAQTQLNGSNGTNANGANYGGWAAASFNAADPSLANGNGVAAGVGSGSQMVGPNSAQSKSASIVNSGATAKGATTNNVAAAGGASASNWANVDTNTNNYAGGFNQEAGNYSGQGNGKASGSGGAIGETTASTKQGPNTATSSVAIYGASNGNLKDATGNTSATGNGVVAEGALVGNPNGTYAGGTANGKSNYNVTGGQSATGFQIIQGSTTGMIGPNSVSAVSQVSSTAGALPTGPSTPPPSSCGCSTHK